MTKCTFKCPPLKRPSGVFPLRNSEGKTWAQVKEEKSQQQ